MIKQYTERELTALREAMKSVLSPHRFSHTVGVEKAAGELAALYFPEAASLLRAAALLHDCTKEWPEEKQALLVKEQGSEEDKALLSHPPVLHGLTAALTIPKDYPAFAEPLLLSAVRWHTTGRWSMTLCDAVLYLADIIEEGRDFPDCVAARELFWQEKPACMGEKERMAHLLAVLQFTFENTIASLERRALAVCAATLEAMTFLKTQTTLLKGYE